ncbi:ABC transporter ATP-binding protein [Endozoicomonas numazuensis]|uniref:Urea ABC transporter ATP-binding protein n=1 Tax=Endozoicomonas numazuensis TaxID=1137799 RepID=A0A081NI91_9GAMM|nr:ABC transporter ATP-binding protein [Endozoicomonas numazuensis]KEQ18164.1 urea ABC transporter ATP-binding protein [Endozoicomonas numazuensis]
MVDKHIPDDTLLYLNNVTVSFDGFKALNNLSFLINNRELRAIIGPNGAGKSTMMDVITGKTRPDTGDVLFNMSKIASPGETKNLFGRSRLNKGSIDLTQYDEAEVANLGIGRKFQKPSVIESLTVWENLELALKGRRSPFESMFKGLSSTGSKKIDETLEKIRLKDRRDLTGASLSHGQKQWLEIGMLLLQDPKLLLIDEPAAGMTDEETFRTADLLRELSEERSLVVVEHDMAFIKALNCKVMVLHEGSVLAEGSLDHVQQDQQVIDVYLGR